MISNNEWRIIIVITDIGISHQGWYFKRVSTPLIVSSIAVYISAVGFRSKSLIIVYLGCFEEKKTIWKASDVRNAFRSWLMGGKTYWEFEYSEAKKLKCLCQGSENSSPFHKFLIVLRYLRYTIVKDTHSKGNRNAVEVSKASKPLLRKRARAPAETSAVFISKIQNNVFYIVWKTSKPPRGLFITKPRGSSALVFWT